MIHHVTHGHDFGFEGWARRERWKIIFQASNFEFVPKVKNIDNWRIAALEVLKFVFFTGDWNM